MRRKRWAWLEGRTAKRNRVSLPLLCVCAICLAAAAVIVIACVRLIALEHEDDKVDTFSPTGVYPGSRYVSDNAGQVVFKWVHASDGRDIPDDIARSNVTSVHLFVSHIAGHEWNHVDVPGFGVPAYGSMWLPLAYSAVPGDQYEYIVEITKRSEVGWPDHISAVLSGGAQSLRLSAIRRDFAPGAACYSNSWRQFGPRIISDGPVVTERFSVNELEYGGLDLGPQVHGPVRSVSFNPCPLAQEFAIKNGRPGRVAVGWLKRDLGSRRVKCIVVYESGQHDILELGTAPSRSRFAAFGVSGIRR